MPEVAEAVIVSQDSELIQMSLETRIQDQGSYDLAITLLKSLIRIRKSIKEYYEPRKDDARKPWQQLVDDEKGFLQTVEAPEKHLRTEVSKWDSYQEQIRRDIEWRAREEAAKIAEEERLRRAVEAEKAGASEAVVAKVLDTPVQVAVPVIERTYEKASGVSGRETWEAEVFDIRALCESIVQGKQASSLVMPNQSALNGMARSLKGFLNIPGVRAVSKKGISVR